MDKYLGKRLDGRYEMRELIGVGGMAYVYKAYDCVDDRTVAVKILKDEFLRNEEFTRRFRNESKAIAILNHPNIVKVLDVGFGEHLQYIVMEYIDGITLKEYLDQRKDIRWKEAVHFTTQILRALQHAHDKGIVHRDIKPQNIMLLSDGTIKVTDFGIARLSRTELRATTENEKAIGSVHYISPEQARGEITDEKADLYSVGVALYEMLTGRLPFEADNAVSVAIMQMQSEPTLPREINADIPEGLEQITMKAMQKDAAMRYQSAAEMLSDIDEFKRNPSIRFEYTYFAEEQPTRYVDAITRVRGEQAVDEEEESETTGKKKVSTVAILAGIAAAVVVVCVVFGFLFFDLLFGGGKEEITVDNFVGMPYEQVMVHPNIGNYELKELQSGYTDEYEENVVYKQEPAAGSTIKMKGSLTLYLSKGSRLEAVPSLTPGELATTVRSRLVSAEFEVEEVEESSSEYKKGTVIRLDPEPGTEVQHGSKITMYISSGEPEEMPISMPNITGYLSNEAIEKLVAAGFSRSKIKTTVINNNAPKNTVLSVSPSGVTQLAPDAEIELTVSSGYQDVSIAMALPNTDTTVDLQFFVAGKQDTVLTQRYTGIVPKDIGTLKFTVGEAEDTYVVTVKISIANKNDFAVYTSYTVDGVKGTYSIKEQNKFNEPAGTTTTEKPTPSADKTTGTTKPNSGAPGSDAENANGNGTGADGES